MEPEGSLPHSQAFQFSISNDGLLETQNMSDIFLQHKNVSVVDVAKSNKWLQLV